MMDTVTLPDRDKAITREDIEREIRLLENNASDCHVRTETVAMLRDIWARVERFEAALTQISSYPASDHPASEAIIISGFVVTAREALKGETTND